MSEMKYKPDPNDSERCQCVRRHDTMEDGANSQCHHRGNYNGLCTSCYRLHGHMLELKKKVSDEQAS